MVAIGLILARPIRPSLPWALWTVCAVVACICMCASGLALLMCTLFADSPNINWSEIWIALFVRLIHFSALVEITIGRGGSRFKIFALASLVISAGAMIHWSANMLTPLDLLPFALLLLSISLRISREKKPNQSPEPVLSSGTSPAGQEPRHP